MITGRRRFNIYLLCVLAALACGCQTNKKDKQLATLQLHMEVVPDAMDFSKRVPVYREKPVMVTVDQDPFLTEDHVAEAKVVDAPGGWQLMIQFDRHGAWLLEQQTTTNPGKHIAVFSEFGHKPKQSRWLGAPVISHRISNGVLTFTPDASREEADEIVLGLNNFAKKAGAKTRW